MSDIIGVSHPLPKELIERFFDKEKDVFIKPAITFRYLKPGMIFVFYQSKEDSGFVGEAKIKTITIAEGYSQLYSSYGSRIYLTKGELKDYIQKDQFKTSTYKKRRTKKKSWMAIELENIKRYNKNVKPQRFVPVSGCYLQSDSSFIQSK